MATSRTIGMRIAAALSMVLAGVAALADNGREMLPTAYRCSGNEPFWGLTIDGPAATYTVPGEPPRSIRGGFRELGYASLFVYRGRGEDGGELVAFISRQVCADTMAEAEEGGGEMPFRVGLSLPDGEARTGCCRPLERATEGSSDSEGRAGDRH